MIRDLKNLILTWIYFIRAWFWHRPRLIRRLGWASRYLLLGFVPEPYLLASRFCNISETQQNDQRWNHLSSLHLTCQIWVNIEIFSKFICLNNISSKLDPNTLCTVNAASTIFSAIDSSLFDKSLNFTFLLCAFVS